MKDFFRLFLIGAFLFLEYRKHSAKGEEDTPAQNYPPPPKTPPSLKYKKQRTKVLSVTQAQLGLDLPMDKTVVYGITMDWHTNWGAQGTFFAYQNGEAGYLFKDGNGFSVQPLQSERVHISVNQLIAVANECWKHAAKANTRPLPPEDTTRFYFLTNHGLFVGDESLDNEENSSSIWFNLNMAAEKALDEVRFVRDYPFST